MTSQVAMKEISRGLSERLLASQPNSEFFQMPFKHLILDNFLDDSLARSCLENFPPIDHPTWEFADDEDIEVKGRSRWKSEFDIPDGIVNVVRLMNSSVLLNALATIFDIKKLVPDPYFTGGGLNIMGRGGVLGTHVDGNYHDATSLNRRMNLMIFLNESWCMDWGGGLSFFDNEARECVKTIEPVFNRLVVFDSHDKSWHGIPSPILCPEGTYRRSIILYYYTKEPRPSGQVTLDVPHSALWERLGWKDKRGNKTREFY